MEDQRSVTGHPKGSEAAAEAHFMQGSHHAAQGEWAAAEAEMARAVRLAPAWQVARYQLGLLQFCTGRTEVALLTWQSLLEPAGHPWLADFVQGFAELALDRPEPAGSHFRRGLARPGVNLSIAADIEKVVAALPAAAGQAASPAASMLIANYGRFGPH